MITRATIHGMRSVHCVRAVFTALAGVEGVARAEVSLGAAVIEHDGRMTPDTLAAALAALGYELAEWRAERTLPVL